MGTAGDLADPACSGAEKGCVSPPPWHDAPSPGGRGFERTAAQPSSLRDPKGGA